MQKNLKISIFGKSYLISTDESSEAVVEAANVVDSRMKSKAEGAVLRGEGQLAVVVALELAADLAKKELLLKQWESKIAALSQVVEAAR